MRMFSNDMRVANTAAPSFQSQANVGQYGWTGADQGHYNQLVQYVDECRKIWINLEEKISYVETILEDVKGLDAQIDIVNRAAASAQQDRIETTAYRDQVFNIYKEWKPLNDQFQIDYTDFSKKYTLVVQMHGETLNAAIAAAQSEVSAAASAQEAKDVAEELRKGQVYRGTWNIETNAAYPAKPDTNSVWDIVLNEGSLEYRFDNTLWYWGDRLLYLKDDDQFTQIEAGGSVTSVNGKKGAVTIDYADVNAAPTGFGLGVGGATLSDKSVNDAKGSGFYSIYSGTTDGPIGNGPSGSNMIHSEWGGGAGATQLFGSYTSDRWFLRRKYQSVYQDWKEIYHTGRKPTPSELGAVAKAGDTITGPIILEPGNVARLTVNNNYVMGSNNGIILRDHGNGNVTLSGGVSSSGTAGSLYLGYNAAQTGTAGFNTSGVRLEVPMSWKGTNVIVNSAGKVPIEAVEGAVPTSGATMAGPLKWLDNNKYVNASGDNMYVAAKLGRIYIEGNSTPIARVAGVDYNMYHQGFKPTATDVGALPITGGDIKGRISVAPAQGQNGIDLLVLPSASGQNAVGVTQWSRDASTRHGGTGVLYQNTTPDYAYLGFGSSPWSKGIKVKDTATEINQPLYVGGNTTITSAGGEMIQLNYTGGDGGHVRGKDGGVNDWYVGRANAQGHVAVYSNKLSNGMIIRDDSIEVTSPIRVGSSGYVIFNQHASTTDLNTLSSSEKVGVYYQDANVNATAARNYPIVEAGTLLVTGSAYGVQQEYTTFSSNRKFVRGKSAAGSSSWYAWKEIGGVKNHMSGFRFTDQTIASGGSVNIQPSLFGSFSGIQMTDGVATVSTSGVYKLEFGFSILPNANPQNAVGGFVKNGAILYGDMIHNYCPASSFGTQMNISSSTVIVALNAGDKLSFQVKAVNNTSVSLYQGGFITITEL